MYRDFGVGQMGDMGAHTMDLLWNSIDAGAPTAIEVDQEVSDKYDPNICPVKLKVSFEHPANQLARARSRWCGIRAASSRTPPKSYIDVTSIGNGAIFEGTKGTIFADFTSRRDHSQQRRRRLHLLQAPHQRARLLPLIGGTGQVTQAAAAAPRAAAPARRAQARVADRGATGPGRRPRLPAGFTRDAQRGARTERISRSSRSSRAAFPPRWACRIPTSRASRPPNKAAGAAVRRATVFQTDWLDACKGKSNNVVHGTSSKTHCDFDYSGTMIEQMLLGLVAHRAGKKTRVRPGHRRVTKCARSQRLPEAHVPLRLDVERVSQNKRSLPHGRGSDRSRDCATIPMMTAPKQLPANAYTPLPPGTVYQPPVRRPRCSPN